ncbi:DUF1496 domain-containing protein [Psychromonas sp. Urea-02u-13]|uniref:DUF1496 domain-containing protein n=1 Tax=Psychromonas sp. Urea-02u-13 TaxID=2058326 RepID=UPI000C337009|nr:DUF1496 domain-containing protein [Psychromonas sp. Urea-02u-13]PKG39547.1 hypothetical protein CXF74_07735 [Psychromonas sp. Urea-02u-13]
MEINNTKSNITAMGISKEIINVMLLSMMLVVCVLSDANANIKKVRVPEGLNSIETKLLVKQGYLNQGNCYHESMAYSQGAVIVVKIDNQPKKLICSNLNSYETNAKLGWKELDAKKSNEVKSKLTVTRG